MWNCWGASPTSFYRYYNQYLSMYQSQMIVIVETCYEPSKLERTFQKLWFNGFLAVNNQGYASGFIVAWIQEAMNVKLVSRKF